MSKTVKVKWNRRGFKNILSAPKLVKELESITEQWADDANAMLDNEYEPNDGFQAYSGQGKSRWQTGVVTRGRYARRANAKHDVLLKVFG